MLELCFVMSPRQNWFFMDLVATVRDELENLGVPSSITTAGVPQARADQILVFVPPHEYVALEGQEALPADPVLARSIFLCAEQPGTVHFEQDVALARRAGAVFDINQRSVMAFHDAGVTAEHFQLGHARRWDHFDADGDRPLDVVFLGAHTLRRSRHLNGYARILAERNCHLQLSDNSQPNTGDSGTFLAEHKWDLLSRAKILLNLHQGDEPYFEWMRALDAFHTGAVLVTEHSAGVAPLTAGAHFMSARPENLAQVADRLLGEPGRLAAIRTAAYDLIRDRLPMRAPVTRLVEAARRLAARPLGDDTSARPVGRERGDGTPQQPVPGDDALAPLRRALKELRLDVMDLQRSLTRLQRTLTAPEDVAAGVRRLGETPAWGARRAPRVSVITALYNHGAQVTEALDSLLMSRWTDFEVVVVDDGSTDGSARAVQAWMRSNPRVPVLLAQHPVNRGLGAARNTAVDFARGELLFVLDSDNMVYPRCLSALAYALDADPSADFAYPMLEGFGLVDAYVASGGSPLLSAFGWDPSRLRQGNYIDAMALLRKGRLRAAGGFTTDRRLYGWEDWDLWCRIAERGGRGVHVPQILARYRTSPASMLAVTNLSATMAMTALIERSPRLMAGVTPLP